jgi:hypothetical protein
MGSGGHVSGSGGRTIFGPPDAGAKMDAQSIQRDAATTKRDTGGTGFGRDTGTMSFRRD